MNSNTNKAVILLSSLTGFMVLVGSWIGGPTGTVIGLVLGLGIVGASCDPAHATAYIVNPLIGGTADFSRLFMTHPPMEDRIDRLLGAPITARLAR
jgi:hypothetical protein